MRLVARHALFCDPTVSRAVPVVFPRTARHIFGRVGDGTVVGGISYWGNQPAKAAIFEAFGLTSRDFTNFRVCHLYPGSAKSHHHFTRLANLAVLPATLASFTDWAPAAAALQRRSFELFGYPGPRRHTPPRPAHYPERWAAPLAPDDLPGTLRRLHWLHDHRPTYAPRPARAKAPALAGFSALDRRWAPPELLPDLEPTSATSKNRGARDLERDLWLACERDPGTLRLFVGWLTRHSYFAPPAIVRAIPNPFPTCRRISPATHERPKTVIRGITLTTNSPAADALLVSIGRPFRQTRGGNVDHVWPDAPQLPAHFCHLGGLALVPKALSTFVDAAPIRALLQRELFERTGYAGPDGRPPPKPAVSPREWPEIVVLTEFETARAIRQLLHYRAQRPGYYRRGARD